jgi:hypothetical protein
LDKVTLSVLGLFKVSSEWVHVLFLALQKPEQNHTFPNTLVFIFTHTLNTVPNYELKFLDQTSGNASTHHISNVLHIWSGIHG